MDTDSALMGRLSWLLLAEDRPVQRVLKEGDKPGWRCSWMTIQKAKTPLKTHLSGGTRGWNRVHYNLSKIQFLTFSGSKFVALYCQKAANLKWNSKFPNLMDSPSTFGPPSQEMVSTPSDPEPAREAQSCQ